MSMRVEIMRAVTKISKTVALILLSGIMAPALWGESSSGLPESGVAVRRRPVRSGPIRSWVRTNGIRLDAVEGTGPTTDLLPMSPWIAGADIIGLGDGTHGTHEYYTVKRRIIQFLAETGIARTVAFEGPWTEFLRVNDYIHGGEGDPRALVYMESFPFWDYEEMVDLIEWARSFNATHPEGQQIELLGFDVLTLESRSAADQVIAYIGEVDPAARAGAVTAYQCVPRSISSSACASSAAGVRQMLEENADAYQTASSERRYLTALQSARVIEQTSAYLRAADKDPLRDEMLTTNVAFLSERWTADEPLVLWAHNEHLGRLPAVGMWKSLGMYLDEIYGNRYFTIGTCMLDGTLATWSGGYSTAVMEPPLPTNYELQFAKGGWDAVLIPLFLPDNPSWLSEPGNLRFGTVSYSPTSQFDHNTSYSLPEKFDAILFIRETTPCIPIESSALVSPSPDR